MRPSAFSASILIPGRQHVPVLSTRATTPCCDAQRGPWRAETAFRGLSSSCHGDVMCRERSGDWELSVVVGVLLCCLLGHEAAMTINVQLAVQFQSELRLHTVSATTTQGDGQAEGKERRDTGVVGDVQRRASAEVGRPDSPCAETKTLPVSLKLWPNSLPNRDRQPDSTHVIYNLVATTSLGN